MRCRRFPSKSRKKITRNRRESTAITLDPTLPQVIAGAAELIHQQSDMPHSRILHFRSRKLPFAGNDLQQRPVCSLYEILPFVLGDDLELKAAFIPLCQTKRILRSDCRMIDANQHTY